MPLAYPTIDQLVSAMVGVSSTNGWDIVTSYSLDRINDLLRSQFAAQQLISQIAIQTTGVSPATGAQFPVAIALSVAAPTVAFVAGVSGQCAVTMPIAGGTYTLGSAA